MLNKGEEASMAYVSDQFPDGSLWKPARFRSESQPSAGKQSELKASEPKAAELFAGLTRAIEADIVAKLVLAHQVVPVTIEPDEIPAGDVAKLAEMILAGDLASAIAHVQSLRDQGRPLEAIYVELLGPTAAHLRNLWNADLCDFADVTLALWRLQQVLREFSTAFRSEGKNPETGLRALLVPAPGEKNELGYVMFGLVMLAEFFRRDGWDAWLEPDTTSKEFRGIIQDQWFDVVELLVSGDKKLDAIAERIRMIRRESPNRSIGVMVCGPAFVEHPELVLLVGADVMANDPRQGSVQAQKVAGLLAKSE
jgi:hypothetical protein